MYRHDSVHSNTIIRIDILSGLFLGSMRQRTNVVNNNGKSSKKAPGKHGKLLHHSVIANTGIDNIYVQTIMTGHYKQSTTMVDLQTARENLKVSGVYFIL